MARGLRIARKTENYDRCGFPDGIPEGLFFSKYGPLFWFTHRLNESRTMGRYEGKDTQEAWQAAERIIDSAWQEVSRQHKDPPTQAVAMFNELAADCSFQLQVNSKGDSVISSKGSPLRKVVRWLWDIYFREHAWDRIKRCGKCEKWFVDVTKNRTTRFGSDYCKNRFYSRAERDRAKERKAKVKTVRKARKEA
jgi:hypothetical protein